jgi:hypothetical protein
MDWATYRRAPLATPTVKPCRSWVKIDGRRRYLRVADEIVELDGYGPARQLTVYERGQVALQILTSDLRTPAARLAYVLRCRWRIENSFKYLEAVCHVAARGRRCVVASPFFAAQLCS